MLLGFHILQARFPINHHPRAIPGRSSIGNPMAYEMALAR